MSMHIPNPLFNRQVDRYVTTLHDVVGLHLSALDETNRREYVEVLVLLGDAMREAYTPDKTHDQIVEAF